MKFSLKRIQNRTIQYAFDEWPRIIQASYAASPLGAGYGSSRFSSPNQSFKVLYAAFDFSTALAEAVIRDRFQGKQCRFLYEPHLDAKVVTTIKTTSNLTLLDLRGSGAYELGVDTDANRAKAHRTGQDLSEALHQQTKIDGILYDSRFTAKPCVVIYDRAFHHLEATKPVGLLHVGALSSELKRLHVTVRRQRAI